MLASLQARWDLKHSPEPGTATMSCLAEVDYAQSKHWLLMYASDVFVFVNYAAQFVVRALRA